MSLSCCTCGSVSAWEPGRRPSEANSSKAFGVGAVEPERNRGEQSDFGVGQPSPYLKQAIFEVDVGGFSLALSSKWTPPTTVAVNPHQCSNTLLSYTLS